MDHFFISVVSLGQILFFGMDISLKMVTRVGQIVSQLTNTSIIDTNEKDDQVNSKTTNIEYWFSGTPIKVD